MESDKFNSLSMNQDLPESNHRSINSLTRQKSQTYTITESIPSDQLNGFQLKLEKFKSWTGRALKYTKQIVEEKLGTSVPTIDSEIQSKVTELTEMRQHYQRISSNVQRISSTIFQLAELQKELSIQLSLTGQRQIDLMDEFSCISETQHIISLNSLKLARSLNVFCDGVNTLCNYTLPDFFDTLRNFEEARVMYDANKCELHRLEMQRHQLEDEALAATNSAYERLKRDYLSSEIDYFNLKLGVEIKSKLLDENRVRVLQKHLLHLHNCTSSYFMGSAQDIVASMKEFSNKLNSNIPRSSCLEESYHSNFALPSSEHDLDQKSSFGMNGLDSYPPEDVLRV